MTLNGVTVIILRNSTEFDSYGGNYVKVVERDLYCLRQ